MVQNPPDRVWMTEQLEDFNCFVGNIPFQSTEGEIKLTYSYHALALLCRCQKFECGVWHPFLVAIMGDN